jgi:hypothetical protein
LYRIITYLSSSTAFSYSVGSSVERDVVEMERQYGSAGEWKNDRVEEWKSGRVEENEKRKGDMSSIPPFLHSSIRGGGGGGEGGGEVVLESPIGDREPLTTIEKEGYPVWKIDGLTTPGIWRITKDGRIIDEFPVNVDVRESVRGVVGKARLSRIFSGNTVRTLSLTEGVAPWVDDTEPHVRELWSLCLIAALAMFGLEMVVAYKK